MTQVLDYSAGFPGAAAIKRAGYAGAVRYIGFPSRTKCTDAAELADFTRHGLGMALVYQDGTGDWQGGTSAGRAAAKRARAHADAIGFPQGRPIYFAIDRDVVTDAQFRAVVDYLDGAGDVLGVELVGVYGERDVTVRARGAGVARWWWQTRAWSGTPVRLDPERHLYQRPGQVYVGGIQCDVNDMLKADWGQHTEEENMPSAKEIVDELLERNVGYFHNDPDKKNPIDVKSALAAGARYSFWGLATLNALKPLIKAAAEGKPLSAEQVKQIADAAAAAVPEDLAADVVDELAERIGVQS